ncbi:MAG TPA: hypothetical protein VHC22_28110 [Pirellulales bacterium]|nr:hypothetical protein [Pirellulales bacterium]
MAALHVAALCSPARAQTVGATAVKGEQDSERSQSRGPAAVERVEPDIYYVRDERGVPLPLLGHSLDEIKRALELVREGAATTQRPGFRLERLVARGEAAEGYAKLTVELSIIASDTGWLRVPLRLGNFVPTELPQFATKSEHFVDFDVDNREYVAWFRGKADEPHQLTLRGLVALENDAGQTRLRFNAPRAVFSELELEVPASKAVGRVASGGMLAETQHRRDRTQFRASGLASDFALSWHDAGAVRAATPAALSVEGRVVAQIDGGGVDTTATLNVSAFGREFDSFQVRLARGATLLPVDGPEYSAREIASPTTAAEDPNERKLVEVRLKAKTTSSVSVKLETKQGHDVTREGTFELGGFDCLGAVRQWGVIAVEVKDDWQVTFAGRQGVLQTDLPSDMRSDRVVAGFVYFGQPYSLPVHVSPRQTRTSVEPSYVVRVGPHHLELDATLTYHIAGAKVFTLSLELNDWVLDEANLDPVTLVNSAALVFGAGNSVLIPLKQPTTGKIELKVRATRPIAAGAMAIDFRLLRPSADMVAPLQLVVLAEDNVVLTPRADDASGLASSAADPEVKLPPHHQPPWFYHSDVPDPHFSADFHVAGRRLATRVEARIALSAGAAKIEETLHCSVTHEAAESLRLIMPAALARNESLEVRCDGTELVVDPAGPEAEPDDGMVAVRVHLPKQQIGPFELNVTYDWPEAAMENLVSGGSTVKLVLPLVMPGEGEFTRGELTVIAEPRAEIESVDKEWTLDRARQQSEGANALSLTASRPRTTVALGVGAVESAASNSLVIERTWVQSWLTDDQRIDRAVFRFHGHDGHVTLRLPTGRVTERFRFDDDDFVTSASQGDGPDERILPLPEDDSPETSHVLEVTYELTERPAGGGRWTLPMPVLLGAASTGPAYWQVVLPRNEFLLLGPASLESDFVWTWRGAAWWRQPLRDTAELEFWSGARRYEDPLPPSVNTYLFSGMGLPAQLELTTISRAELILFPSGVLLLLGLLWIYVPALRRAEWLFASAVVMLSAAAMWPDLALLAVQSAVIGLLLIGLAAMLERRWGQRRQQVVFRSGPSSIVGRSSTFTHPRTALSAPTSTQTAAVVMEMGSEAKP